MTHINNQACKEWFTMGWIQEFQSPGKGAAQYIRGKIMDTHRISNNSKLGRGRGETAANNLEYLSRFGLKRLSKNQIKTSESST